MLCAKLRPSDIDAAAGALKQLQRIIGQIRQAWPQVKILIRGDSGFCREPIMAWCEANGVDYLLGLAQNKRLLAMITEPTEQARLEYQRTGEPARVFAELRYRTLDSWSRERRVVAKAEHLNKGANPRFVVTSLSARSSGRPACCTRRITAAGARWRTGSRSSNSTCSPIGRAARRCGPTRSGCSSRRSLMCCWRRCGGWGWRGPKWPGAQCQTIRLKLLKIGALVRVTVRKVWVSLASSCPYAEVFRRVHARLSGVGPPILRG